MMMKSASPPMRGTIPPLGMSCKRPRPARMHGLQRGAGARGLQLLWPGRKRSLNMARRRGRGVGMPAKPVSLPYRLWSFK